MTSSSRGHFEGGHWPPALVASRYELRAEIGRGGCATVFEARDLRLERLVALKILRPGANDAAAIERLAREARVAAAIHHPNVCLVTDAGWIDDRTPFLVMERLYGETLRGCLARVGALGPEEAVDMALQLLSGLAAAHALGIVHRDVKPENVYLVARHGCAPLVKLLDFGLCRRASQVTLDDRTLTRAGTVVGTPEYMAPEQASGRRSFDARVDLYAVGVLLYEALTGARAFAAADPRAVLVSVLTKKIAPLRALRPDLPRALDDVVSRALERDRAMRYASAADFQRDLHAAQAALAAWRAGEGAARGPRRVPPLGHTEWEMPTRPVRARVG